MTPSVTSETAKIYAFPTGGRLGVDRREHGRPVADAKATQAPVAFASCGYHESALVEADRSRKP